MPKRISQFLPFEPVAKLIESLLLIQTQGHPGPQNPFQVQDHSIFPHWRLPSVKVTSRAMSINTYGGFIKTDGLYNEKSH